VDIRAFLAEQGLGEEEITAIVGNAQSAKAMTAALSRYEEGSNALSAAQRERQEATDFWEQKVTPALANVDRRVATAESDSARYKTYLQSLKSQGYDVPDALLSGAQTTPVENPGNPAYVTKDYVEQQFATVGKNTAPSLIALTKLSNEYTDLHGAPYLSIEEDFAEAQKRGKSLTDFAREKYSFAAKRAERETKKQQDLINQQVEEKFKVREAELAAKYGSNADLRSPMPSKFDAIAKLADRKDSWKQNIGGGPNRGTAHSDRLNKFQNIRLQ
jgi:hypothetical protein